MASTVEQQQPKHSNKLAKEESPYLLQHAHNPVDWYAWGQEAIEKARREDKPIFLSVGYSTCHWCHVMERESFESEEIAEIMNANFVNIKVDREERPDVDKVYMMYVQFSSGHGGWPMSVFMTPDLNPFFGGTYFPVQDMIVGGEVARPGFKSLLQKIANLWKERAQDIKQGSAESMDEIKKLTKVSSSIDELSDTMAGEAMDKCFEALTKSFDSKLGGFGGPPKFPRPCEINLMFRQHLRNTRQNKEEADPNDKNNPLKMALFSLEQMSRGGMYDHLGGGFHRYSVDEFWHVPHFEKMLYDNPQLVLTYLDAFEITGDQKFARVTRGILDYLMRDMRNKDKGGIYSAEDADSLDTQKNQKTEGAFYVWEANEVQQVLSNLKTEDEVDLLRLFNEHYFVNETGNCNLSQRSDPHKEFINKNVLYQIQSVSDTAADFNLTAEQAEKYLSDCREALHAVRANRPRPHLDDKVVSAWNGMSISAFALASRVLKSENPKIERSFPVEGYEPEVYQDVAVGIARAVQKNLYSAESGKLLRSFCKGPSQVEGFADDYAYMIQGLLDLYECSGSTEWLDWATKLQSKMDELFWDNDGGGYYSSSDSDPTVLLRMKEDYDGAEPAPSSIAVTNLWRLAGLVGGEKRERVLKTIAAFEDRLKKAPVAMPQMCCAMFLAYGGPAKQVIVCGKLNDKKTQQLIDAVHSKFSPNKVIIILDPSNPHNLSFWEEKNKKAYDMGMAAYQKQGDSVVCVCQNYSCQAPTSDPVKIQELLLGSSQPSSLQQVDLSKLGVQSG